MFTPNCSKGFKWFLVVGLAVVGLILVSGLAVASSNCKKVKGDFVLQPVTGPACTSPVGICATGTYKGGIKGSSQFTGSSLVPTADTPSSGVVLLTGDNLIQTEQGSLTTKDAIVLRTTGAGEFSEVDVVVGGTGEFAGASGVIQAVGTFTADGGAGEYQGEICTP